jgi:hypothetical protein
MRSLNSQQPTNEAALDGGSIVMDALRGWDRFWFSPMDPTSLCFIRLCAGLLILYVHVTYSWDLLGYVGPNAWLQKNVADYVRRDVPIYGIGGDWDNQVKVIGKGNYFWSVYFHVTDTGWIIGLHVFFLTMMLLMTLGLFTRYTTALSWLGAMSYVQRASTTVFGLDTMMMIVLCYLTIGPSGATLSLDRWLEKRRARKRGLPVPEVQPSVLANFVIRLIQVHFCTVYLAAGTSKLLGATWWSGTSLNLVMLNAEFAPLHTAPYYYTLKFLASHRWMWEAFMAVNIVGTLFLEIGFPFLVWIPRLRWAMICGSVLLHTGIAFFMGLTTFSVIMVCMVASFIPPAVIQDLATRVSERISRLFAGQRAAVEEPRKLVLTQT